MLLLPALGLEDVVLGIVKTVLLGVGGARGTQVQRLFLIFNCPRSMLTISRQASAQNLSLFFLEGLPSAELGVCPRLESVRNHYAGLQSFRSMRRIDERRRKASALRLWLSLKWTPSVGPPGR